MSVTGISLLTVVVLFHGARMLLLRRAPWKAFAPNRWTGIGGKVEPGELGDLLGAAKRELHEETDLAPEEVARLRLRRTLTFDRPGEGLVCLLYLTGRATSDRVPESSEGTLAWVAPEELDRLDIVENTAAVLHRLVEDEQAGDARVCCGIASYSADGKLARITFEPDAEGQG
jgi:8-oxo-dGTP diphosphatase